MEFGGDNMNEAPDVAAIVEIFSNSARVKMVDMLMDGRAHTVNELALAAKITPQTATYHLQKMVGLNWLKLEKYGRFHYYTLIRSDVATLFETLSPVAPEKKVASLNKSLKYKKLYYCRTCYDHVAGRIGVAITDKLIENGAIALESANFNVTQSGRTFLSSTFNLNLINYKFNPNKPDKSHNSSKKDRGIKQYVSKTDLKRFTSYHIRVMLDDHHNILKID